MPQILRNPNDTITVTVDGSSARYPTAVALPTRGTGRGEAESFWVSPKTNEGRLAWEGTEGVAVAVASSSVLPSGGVLSLPIPRTPKTEAAALLKRHVVTIKVDTALADGEYFTVSDGTNSISLEADPSNNGVNAARTEIGANAATAADQATGIAAALIAWASAAYVRGQVDAESTSTVVAMAQTAAKTIAITHAGTVTSTTTDGDVTTTVVDLGTGIITVTDYGKDRPIVYVLSETTSTAISLGSAEA